MKNNGWIKLHRKITESWIWNDPDKLRAWIDILLMVNHEEREIELNGEVITIYPGQRLTSLAKLADRWGWTRNRVKRFLGTLSDTDMVTVNSTANGTVLTVVNWVSYQGARYSKRYSERYTDEATGGPQTRMIKNDKESIRTRARATDRFNNHPEHERDMGSLERMLLETQWEEDE